MESDLRQLRLLLKRAIELCMPDLRRYYRVVRKARVVKAYASDGRYFCDVRPLRNDESEDPAEPVIPRVGIPVLWAGPDRGVVCPPKAGVICDLAYYDGDPNFPHVSNFRWPEDKAPACELDDFIIQADPQTYVKIDAQRRIIQVTPAHKLTEVGGDKAEEIGGTLIQDVAGGRQETVGGGWTVQVAGDAVVESGGKVVLRKVGGASDGVVTARCLCNVTGLAHRDASIIVEAGKA